MLTENLLLAIWMLRLLAGWRMPIDFFAANTDNRVDGRILAFTVVASVWTTLLFGPVPALQATRCDQHIAELQSAKPL